MLNLIQKWEVLKHKKALAKRKDLREFYLSEQGRRELKRLIIDGKLLETMATPEDITLHNYVIFRLTEAGLLDEDVIDEFIGFVKDKNLDMRDSKFIEEVNNGSRRDDGQPY